MVIFAAAVAAVLFAGPAAASANPEVYSRSLITAAGASALHAGPDLPRTGSPCKRHASARHRTCPVCAAPCIARSATRNRNKARAALPRDRKPDLIMARTALAAEDATAHLKLGQYVSSQRAHIFPDVLSRTAHLRY